VVRRKEKRGEAMEEGRRKKKDHEKGSRDVNRVRTKT
jgi:hypothetical protein